MMQTPILIIFLCGFNIIYDAEAYPAQNEPSNDSVYNDLHCIKLTPEIEDKMTVIVTKISDYLYNLTVEYDIFDIRLLKIAIDRHSDDETEEKDTQIELVVNDCDDPKADGGDSVNSNEQDDISSDDAGESQNDEDDTSVDQENTTELSESNDQYENSYATQSYDQSTASETSDDSSLDDSDESDTQDSATIDENDELSDDETDVEDSQYTENSVNSQQTTSADQTDDLDQSELDTGNADSGIDVNKLQGSSDANFEVPGPVLVRLDLDKNGNKLIEATEVKRGQHVPLLLYIQKLLGTTQYLFAN